jgi:opacity protein-like surface antigen
MKTLAAFSSRLIGVTLLSVCAVSAFGQGAPFYMKVDAGGTIMSDTDLKEFFGPVAPDTKVKFNPGFRAGLAGGYFFTEWFALEGETAFMQNKIDSITGADRVHDAWFANIPFLANAKLQLPNQSPFTPYVGAGAGFSISMIDVSEISLNGTSFNGNISDTVFAWQAFAGLRYKINSQMGLSFEYRYFDADGARWTADFTSGTSSDTMRFGRTQTHCFSLAFDFHF